jgi:hypothetical protein
VTSDLRSRYQKLRVGRLGIRASLLGILCLAPGSLLAQEPKNVDPHLLYAVTGGYWERGDVHGQFRILVYSGGFEHIISHVFVQWLRDPQASDQPPELVASEPIRPINDQPTWSVGLPSLVSEKRNVAIVNLKMVNSHTEENETRTCILRLALPGQYTVTLILPHSSGQ